MEWRGPTLKLLDDEHAPAAAWTGRFIAIGCFISWFVAELWRGEQFAGACDVIGAARFGEQAVVAAVVEDLGRPVDEGAGGELVGCERHSLVSVAALDPVILAFEDDAS